MPDVILIHDQQWADGVPRCLHHLHSILNPLVPNVLVREDDATVELLKAHCNDESTPQLLDLVVDELLLCDIHRRLRICHEDILLHPAPLDPRNLLIACAVTFIARYQFEPYDVVRRAVQQLCLLLGRYRVERRR